MCPYCKNTTYSKSFLPSTAFNNKIFRYLTCTSCNTIYINPLPNGDDFTQMYPVSYQSGVDKTILKDLYKKLPGLRFSYGIQFDFIKNHAPNNPKILDYGCGNANFIINAISVGFKCDGTEFSANQVQILKNEIPQSGFYAIYDFLDDKKLRYDVIRLSNVLEHMDTPCETIGILIKKLTENGILLVEGPVETNFNLAFLTRKIYFMIKHRIHSEYISDHLPTHITFTNRRNQLAFFTNFKLETLEYKITEAGWPYPSSIKSAKGLGAKIKACIATCSIFLSLLTNTWGNTFLYIGKK